MDSCTDEQPDVSVMELHGIMEWPLFSKWIILSMMQVDRRPVTLKFNSVKDDGWTILAEELRAKIRPVNAYPSDYYHIYPRVDRCVGREE